MKHFIRLGLVVLTLVVAVAGSVVILYVASDHGGGENHGGGGNHGSQRGRARFGGEVTEVTSATVTVSGYGNSGGHGPIHPRHSISDTHRADRYPFYHRKRRLYTGCLLHRHHRCPPG